MTYIDDRYGLMRVHVADDRARLACDQYKRDDLRAWAKTHGMKVVRGSLRKRDFAWYMAQHGLIDDAGSLRAGFPQSGADQ